MVELAPLKQKADLQSYFGVPVLVQLHAPMVIVSVKEKIALPYTDRPDEKQWIPQETQDAQENFVTVQVMRYAVLHDLPGDAVEMVYSAPGPVAGTLAQFATLLDTKNIAYVTRIGHVPESATPSLIVKP